MRLASTLLLCSLVALAACGETEPGSVNGTSGAGQSGGSAAGAAGSGKAGATAGGSSAGQAQAGSSGSSAGAAAGGSAAGAGGAAAAGGTAGSAAGRDPGGVKLVDCNPAHVTCKIAVPDCPGFEVARVDGTCWGECVPIAACACSQADDCPNQNEFTCWKQEHCGPFVK